MPDHAQAIRAYESCKSDYHQAASNIGFAVAMLGRSDERKKLIDRANSDERFGRSIGLLAAGFYNSSCFSLCRLLDNGGRDRVRLQELGQRMRHPFVTSRTEADRANSIIREFDRAVKSAEAAFNRSDIKDIRDKFLAHSILNGRDGLNAPFADLEELVNFSRIALENAGILLGGGAVLTIDWYSREHGSFVDLIEERW